MGCGYVVQMGVQPLVGIDKFGRPLHKGVAEV